MYMRGASRAHLSLRCPIIVHSATCPHVAAGSNRLQRENQRFALLTACADGGLAHACILER